MTVIGFDGKEHKFNYSKYNYRKNRGNKSSHHKRAYSVIKELFPNLSVYEEVTLPGSKRIGRKTLLYADFFIPDLMLVIEVHGKQHYKYIPFFHDTKMNFIKAKQRDSDKKEWCEMNDIDLLALPHYEKDEEWKLKIMKIRSRD